MSATMFSRLAMLTYYSSLQSAGMPGATMIQFYVDAPTEPSNINSDVQVHCSDETRGLWNNSYMLDI